MEIQERIVPINIEDEMKNSYIDYAMSVIVGRALPDVRDGLKPVHRRILFAMNEMGMGNDKPYRKSARIVGEVLGKYHPHGDMAVYDTMVRMAQDFSCRYLLVDGQGNFGSVDGDSPAAMRYTESRLTAIAEDLLEDIDKETIDFVPNFDDSLKEPTVLPAKFPHLLLNGSTGIAVGMATNIPPHNLTELISAIVRLLDEPEMEENKFISLISGPDFPTGGIIYGREGIRDAYTTGRGKIVVRARFEIEEVKGGRENIIITEIPYQVNKGMLLKKIGELIQTKRIEGLSDLRDESDREGMRIVIELKRNAQANIIINQLYKHTPLQTTFGVIMLALVNNQPKILTLKEMVYAFLQHRREVVRKRTEYELRVAEARAHILEGFKIALDNLDAVIKLIRASKTTKEAREGLIREFALSEKQAQAILEMQLQRLTGLEQEKIEKEYLALIKEIARLKFILENTREIDLIIKEELLEIKKAYGDERRTQIVDATSELSIEDLLPEEDMIITISHTGYIKRLPVTTYRQQRRGGKGVTGMETKQEDFVEHLFIASTHNYILFFTNKGKVYWRKVHEIPQAGRTSRGTPVVNLIQVEKGEIISAFIPIHQFDPDHYLIMATRKGLVKKTALSEYSRPRTSGIIALKLDEGDELVGVKLTDGSQEILLATRTGKSIRFPETDVRSVGRDSRGVKGIRFGGWKDEVIGMGVVMPEMTLVTVTEYGFGKRTKVSEYRTQARGGQGIINIKITPRGGEVVGILGVDNDDELMIITQSGMVIRSAVQDMRPMGRSTQGVSAIRLNEGDRVTSVTKVVGKEEEEEEKV
ncbi:MAG: DNA gyrase subunit A [bacterium]|nr:DNA gyrase subunit A [bacterium]